MKDRSDGVEAISFVWIDELSRDTGRMESECYFAMINKSRVKFEQVMYPSSVFPLGFSCLLPTSMLSGVVYSYNATWERMDGIRWWTGSQSVSIFAQMCVCACRGCVKMLCVCVKGEDIVGRMVDSWIASSGPEGFTHQRNIACWCVWRRWQPASPRYQLPPHHRKQYSRSRRLGWVKADALTSGCPWRGSRGNGESYSDV